MFAVLDIYFPFLFRDESESVQFDATQEVEGKKRN